MTESPKKRALIVRNFKDEGTGQRFEKDATPLIDAGAFANYEAAGLVTTPPPTKAAAAPKAPAAPKSAKATKPRAKAKAASKPKSKPTAPAAPAAAPIAPAQPDTPPAGGADPAAV